MSNSRRSFLKLIGLGALVAPAAVAMVGHNEKVTSNGTDYFVKEYMKEDVTFLEYTFPPTVQAIFKHPDQRKRAIYCPIRRMNVQFEKKMIKTPSWDRKPSEVFPRGVEDIYSSEQITEEMLIAQNFNYAKMLMEGKGDKTTFSFQKKAPFMDEVGKTFNTAYVYIVHIKDHPELFGTMINKARLQVELDAYTYY